MSKYTVEKDWEYNGMRCVAIAIHDIGHRCGYVGVNKKHPLYGLEESVGSKKLLKLWKKVKNGPIGKRGVIPIFCKDWNEDTLPSCDVVFNVHGGITFSGNGSGKYPVESDLWWFGFDCGHCDDKPDISIMPDGSYKDHLQSYHMRTGTVRTLEYVVGECESFVDQIKMLK